MKISKSLWCLLRYGSVVLMGAGVGYSWPLASARIRPVLPAYQSRILPDYAKVPTLLGYPATGLAHADDGTLWGGVGLTRPSEMAGVVQMPDDGSQLLKTITLGDLGLPPASVQGVATEGKHVWFIAKARPAAKLVEIDTDGHLLRSADVRIRNGNGLAYDKKRDALIIITDQGVTRWIDRATLEPLQLRGAIKVEQPDHLYHDAKQDRLYISWGRNGRDGYVSVYQLPGFESVAVVRLQGADAIEGIALAPDGQTLKVANDAGTHNGYPMVNRLLEYRLAL